MTAEESAEVVAALDLVDDVDQAKAARNLVALVDEDAELFPETDSTVDVFLDREKIRARIEAALGLSPSDVAAAVMVEVDGLVSTNRNLHALLQAAERARLGGPVVEQSADAGTPDPTLVDQRTENDCLRAAVAMATRLPYEDAPDLVDSEEWRSELRAWARERGGDFVFAGPDAIDLDQVGRYIASGPSPRGNFSHAVVMDRGGEHGTAVYDPHLSRAGLPSGVAEVIVWCAPYDALPDVPWIDAAAERRSSGPAAAAADGLLKQPVGWRPRARERVLVVNDEAGEYPGTVMRVRDPARRSTPRRIGVKWDHADGITYYAVEDLAPVTPPQEDPSEH